jgi:cytochrome c553
MADEPMAANKIDRSWRLWASGIVGSIVLVGALLAFLVLPNFQRENAGLDLWSAFCRSLGISAGSPAYRQVPSNAKALPVSRVAWDPEVLRLLASGEVQRGAAIAAENCAACHGEHGVSVTADLPSLSGQSAAAIYKELSDYRSGARVHAMMTPVARKLSIPDLANVAAYFGRGGQDYGLGAQQNIGTPEIIRLATEGDSSRRIASCNSCHVNGSGGPPEAPVLTGQSHEYLARQLMLFKTGGRGNDVYRRMRAIAGQLSDEEIAQLARYYQGVH